MKSRLTLAAGLCTALAASAQAEVKINESFAVSGYAVATGAVFDPDSGSSEGTFFDSGATNLDAVKVALAGQHESLSGKVSLFYVPESTSGNSEAGLLDGFATYSAGPVSVTGGKFLSYLGYEAWDPINMTTISYGNSWAFIPGYHTGGKVDYAGESFALGAAIVDSLYMDSDHFFGGDGDFGNGLGYEAYANFTGVEKLTIFVGVGIEDSDDNADLVTVYNFWTSYAVSDSFTVAGELSLADDSTDSDLAGALFGIYTFSDAVSATFRVSGALESDVRDNGLAFTFSPTYTINELFSVRGEVTYADSDDSAIQVPGAKGLFYAIQGVFKF